ncbi:SUKH-3 domain-containing protein [Amycolatopsis sp. NPDC049868]|uniref:SUKH-3 domain-containing protein n=1 Tax=Amycolatopsis sp. NPDC049868 TaxID=3363934 RepID=UPI00379CC100
MTRFSAEVEHVLRSSGWEPGRHVDTTVWRRTLEADGLVHMHEAAERFLAEFGGLRVNLSGGGVSRAREPFEFNPGDVESETDRFADWGTHLGMNLFPIGEFDRGRYFLGISEHAEIVLVETWVASFGTGDTGLENLILGVAPKVISETS